MEQLVEGYLQQKWNSINNGTAKQVTVKCTQTVTNQTGATLNVLEQQLESDKLQIHETARNFEKKTPPPEPVQSTDQRLREILQKKEQMMRRLNQMALEESKLKDNNRQSQPLLNRPKSEFTADDVQMLKSLNHSYRKFQKELQKKTKQYEEKQRQFKQEEMELEQKHKEEGIKVKRDEISAKLEQIRQREQQRQQKQAQQEKILAEMRSKRVLYQEWEEKFAEQQQQQKKRLEQMQQEARKLRSTDFESIRDHKRRYEEMIAKQREERMNRLAQVRKEVAEAEKYPESKFYSIIKEEEQRQHEQNQEKNKNPKLYFSKRMEYAEKVKQDILPTLKMRRTQQETEEERLKKKQMRSLSVNELISKGNEYMHQARNIIKKDTPHNGNTEADQSKDKPPEPIRYKNYLTEIRSNNDVSRSELSKLHALIDKDDLDQDRLYRAKMLATKMEKSAGNNSRKLMESIQAKIDILNKLT